MQNNKNHQQVFRILPPRKKAQTGETLTWFIATMVIVVILSMTIYISVNVLNNSGFEESKTKDLFAQKSLTAYLLTEINSETIYDQLVLDEELNDSSGFFAKKVFNELYLNKGYNAVWVGIYDDSKLPDNEIYNTYFKGAPSGYSGSSGPGPGRAYSKISEKIHLNKDKYVEIVLVEKFI